MAVPRRRLPRGSLTQGSDGPVPVPAGGKSLAGAAWRGGRGERGFGVNATVGLKASQLEALGYAPCGGFL